MYGENNRADDLVRDVVRRAGSAMDWSGYVALYRDPWAPSPYARAEDRAPALGQARCVDEAFGVWEWEVRDVRTRERSVRRLGTLRTGTDGEGNVTLAIVEEHGTQSR